MKCFCIILLMAWFCLEVAKSENKPSKVEMSINAVKQVVNEYEAYIKDIHSSLQATELEIARLMSQITPDYQSSINACPTYLSAAQYFVNRLRPEAYNNVSSLFEEGLNISKNTEHRDVVLSVIPSLMQDIDHVRSVINNRTVVTNATIESCRDCKTQKKIYKCLYDILEYYEGVRENFIVLNNDVNQKLVNLKIRVNEYIGNVSKCITLLDRVYTEARISTDDIELSLNNSLMLLKNSTMINRLSDIEMWAPIFILEELHRDQEYGVKYDTYVLVYVRDIVKDAVYFTVATAKVNLTNFQQILTDANSFYLNLFYNEYTGYFNSYLSERSYQVAFEASSRYRAIVDYKFDYSACPNRTVYVYGACILYVSKYVYVIESTNDLINRYIELEKNYDVLINVELEQRKTYGSILYNKYKNQIIPKIENVFQNFTFAYLSFNDYLMPMINSVYTNSINNIDSCYAQNAGPYYRKLNTTFNSIVDLLHNVTNKYSALNNFAVVGVIETLTNNLTTKVYVKSKSVIDAFIGTNDVKQQINDDYNLIQNNDCNNVSLNIAESFLCIDEKKQFFSSKASGLAYVYCDKFYFDPFSGDESKVNPLSIFYTAYSYIAVDLKTARDALSAYQDIVYVFNCLLLLLDSLPSIHYPEPYYSYYVTQRVYSCGQYV